MCDEKCPEDVEIKINLDGSEWSGCSRKCAKAMCFAHSNFLRKLKKDDKVSFLASLFFMKKFVEDEMKDLPPELKADSLAFGRAVDTEAEAERLRIEAVKKEQAETAAKLKVESERIEAEKKALAIEKEKQEKYEEMGKGGVSQKAIDAVAPVVPASRIVQNFGRSIENLWPLKPGQISIVELSKICQEYVEFRQSPDYHEDNDFPHYIYEVALQTIYGPEIFDFLNKKE